MTAPDIFLSYNRDDGSVARLFADAFAREGLDVWWDQTLRSGETYDEVTEAALRGARAVVVLWSPRSVASHWVRAEATVAHRAKTLVPATIEPCDKPVLFELTQTADLSHWRGEADDGAWRSFLADVRRMIGKEAQDARPSAAGDTARAPAATGGVPFIGVLPFTHKAGDDELEVLAEDLTEDTTRELARDSFFKVIAASTMALWRGARIDHRQVAQELGTSYLVEGKLQRLGDNLRVTVHAIDAATGGMLRSARFVRSLAGIAQSPEELPAAIAAEFGESITQSEAKRALTRQGLLSGWDHAMRTVGLLERLDASRIHRAMAEARSALAKVPDLGLAHALVARLVCLVALLDKQRVSAEERREIEEHIGRAMLLDGDSPAILHYVVGGYVNLGDSASALRIARRLLELNPNSPRSHFTLGQALHVCGRYDEAIAAFRRQLSFAPLDLNRAHGIEMLGLCLMLVGNLDEASEVLDQLLALHPSYGLGLALKAIASARQGHESAARAMAEQVWRTAEGWTIDQQMVVMRNLFREQAPEVESILRRLWQSGPDEGAAN